MTLISTSSSVRAAQPSKGSSLVVLLAPAEDGRATGALCPPPPVAPPAILPEVALLLPCSTPHSGREGARHTTRASRLARLGLGVGERERRERRKDG
jgi:hypothetical protein